MEIKAADVAKLRKMTGAGMMDCKKALLEAEGDFTRAQDIIREKGKLVAAKRADRQTSEGAVIALTNANSTEAILVCLGCETDFVAGNDEFKTLANNIAKAALASMPNDLDGLKATKMGDITVEEAVSLQTGKTGEKHALAFYNKIEAPYVSTYNHFNGKLGAIVGFNKKVDEKLGKDIAMQVVAMKPLALDRTGIPQEAIDKEMAIYREQILAEGKPENMVDRIAQGKLNKFFKENTLEDQIFEQDGKLSVKEYIKTQDAEAKVVLFYYFSLND